MRYTVTDLDMGPLLILGNKKKSQKEEKPAGQATHPAPPKVWIHHWYMCMRYFPLKKLK